MCQGNGPIPLNGRRPVNITPIQFGSLHELIARAIQDCAPELVKPLLDASASPDAEKADPNPPAPARVDSDSTPSTRNASPSPTPLPMRKPVSVAELPQPRESTPSPTPAGPPSSLRKVKSHGDNLDELAVSFERTGREAPAVLSRQPQQAQEEVDADDNVEDEEKEEEDEAQDAAARRRGLEVDANMDAFPGPRKLEILSHWLDCVCALERVYRNYPSSATRSVDTKLLIEMVDRKRADLARDGTTPILRLVRRMQQELFAKRTPSHFLSTASPPLTSGGPSPSAHHQQRSHRRSARPYSLGRLTSGPPSRSRSPELADLASDPLLGAPATLKVCVHRGPPVRPVFYPDGLPLGAPRPPLDPNDFPMADVVRPRYYSMPMAPT